MRWWPPEPSEVYDTPQAYEAYLKLPLYFGGVTRGELGDGDGRVQEDEASVGLDCSGEGRKELGERLFFFRRW